MGDPDLIPDSVLRSMAKRHDTDSCCLSMMQCCGVCDSVYVYELLSLREAARRLLDNNGEDSFSAAASDLRDLLPEGPDEP